MQTGFGFDVVTLANYLEKHVAGFKVPSCNSKILRRDRSAKRLGGVDSSSFCVLWVSLAEY